jgi:peroxiredoxin
MRCGFILAGLLTLAAAQPGLEAQDAAAAARTIVAGIAAEEAKSGPARHTLSVAERRGKFVENETREVMRGRLAGEVAVLAEGTFTYGADGWVKELGVAASASNPLPSTTRTGASGEILRFRVEAPVDGKPQTRAFLSRLATATPGDAMLSNRVALSLAGVNWTSLKRDGELTTLTGARGMERHTVVLSQAPRLGVQSWELARTVPLPQGRTAEQTYLAEVTRDPAGAAQRIQEWVVSPPPAGTVAYRETTIKKSESLPGVKPEELAVRLPKGTIVADARTGGIAEYELLEDDPGSQASPVTEAVGKPAPPVEVKSTGGKSVKLDRDKPVLLIWFSAASTATENVAEVVDALIDEYRKKGVQFLGLETAAAGDAGAQAEAFAKRVKWSLPLALDPGGELASRFGILRAVPAVALVDRQGKIVYARTGVDPVTLAAALDSLKK